MTLPFQLPSTKRLAPLLPQPELSTNYDDFHCPDSNLGTENHSSSSVSNVALPSEETEQVELQLEPTPMASVAYPSTETGFLDGSCPDADIKTDADEVDASNANLQDVPTMSESHVDSSNSTKYEEPASNPLSSITYQTTNPTVDTAPPVPAYIDTSIPIAHPDMAKPSYETIDQMKYNISKEIQQTKNLTSTPTGMKKIFYADEFF